VSAAITDADRNAAPYVGDGALELVAAASEVVRAFRDSRRITGDQRDTLQVLESVLNRPATPRTGSTP
jgi:hypothetical protein